MFFVMTQGAEQQGFVPLKWLGQSGWLSGPLGSIMLEFHHFKGMLVREMTLHPDSMKMALWDNCELLTHSVVFSPSTNWQKGHSPPTVKQSLLMKGTISSDWHKGYRWRDNPLRYSFPGRLVHNIYWRHETAVLNFLCGLLVTRCAHEAARTMLLVISTELCLLRWVASSGYIDDDDGFGQEDEMLQNFICLNSMCVCLCVLVL